MKEGLLSALVASFVRKFITYVAGVLMGAGYINLELHERLTNEAVSLISMSVVAFLLSAWLSYKNVIFEFVKTRLGILMPPNSTLEEVSALAKTVETPLAVAKGEVNAEDVLPKENKK